MGRLRINAKLRLQPAPRTGQKGRPPVHGAVLHPGTDEPEVAPAQECYIAGQEEPIHLRRWSEVHCAEFPTTILDVVRVDDPSDDKPLLLGSTARELRTEEFLSGYQLRSTIETNFYVGQDSCAMAMPRAFTEPAVTRRIRLACWQARR